MAPVPEIKTSAAKPAEPLLRRVWRDRRLLATVIVGLVLLALIPFAVSWLAFRFTHSITEDAFVESHLVNLGPQVSGHITEALVEEHDRIEKGQLLALIDPVPYLRQVELANAKLEVAKSELAKEESVLQRLTEEVPRKIKIAEKELNIAEADQEKAKRTLELTKQNVAKAIAEAQAGVDAAQAALVNATEDYERYSKLFAEKSVPEKKFQDVTRTWKTAKADVAATEAALAKAKAAELQIKIAEQTEQAAQHQTQKGSEAVEVAKLGKLVIEEARRQVQVKSAQVDEARRSLAVAETNLTYTRVTAPFNGIVVKRYRHLGDFVPIGAPVLTVYNTDLTYVTAHMEETRLEGIAPGNRARLDVDAFSKPLSGRVIWIGKATGANFALVPRDVSSGEFTKVVQRVPIRIWIEKDERWNQLRPGLSVTVSIEHGPGDPEWARKAAAEELRLESGGGETNDE